jgi:hypothetical protein
MEPSCCVSIFVNQRVSPYQSRVFTKHFIYKLLCCKYMLNVLNPRHEKPRKSLHNGRQACHRLTKQALPKYSHAKNPYHFERPQLAACVVMMFCLDLGYRDMEEWLLATDKVCQALELLRIPDHTTLQRIYTKLRKLDFEKMKNQILEEEHVQEESIASDSTGCSPGQASLYYQTCSERTYEYWIKGAYVVGTASQYILAWQAGYGPINDVARLNALKCGCARFGTHSKTKQRTWEMLADAGFDPKKLSPLDIIPPVRRPGKLLHPERKARTDLVASARLDRLFGQRLKAETVNSVIRRKFGDTIRSRTLRLQRREPIIKAMVDNIHR